MVCLRVGGPLAAGCAYIISLNLVSLTFAVDFGGGPIGVFVADLRTSAKISISKREDNEQVINLLASVVSSTLVSVQVESVAVFFVVLKDLLEF